MITEKEIRDAYIFLRKNNFSIPDDTLDFIKEAALEKLKAIPLDAVVSPHTKNFENWLNKYFVLSEGLHYRSNYNELYTLDELHRKFKRAMHESPFVSG